MCGYPRRVQPMERMGIVLENLRRRYSNENKDTFVHRKIGSRDQNVCYQLLRVFWCLEQLGAVLKILWRWNYEQTAILPRRNRW